MSHLDSAAHPISPPEAWDARCDVLVIGTGAAGSLAALRASHQGRSVFMLEKLPYSHWGGSTAASGGIFWIPNNRHMAAEGLSDSRGEALAYLRALAQDQVDDELIVAYVDHCNEMLAFVEANSELEFQLYRRGQKPFPDYHPEWPGGKTGGRGIYPKPYKGLQYGMALTMGLREAIRGRGIPVWYRSPVERLVVDAEGVITGAQGRKLEAPYSIRADNGVVLACGGFEWNPTMMRHFLRGPSPINNTPENANTGDGLLMALSVGADVRNLNAAWGVPIYDLPETSSGLADWFQWRGKPGAIMVNRYGRRFCNESADYSSTWRSFFAWENWGATGYANVPAYTIVDAEMVERYGFLTAAEGKEDPTLDVLKAPSVPAWIARGDSLAELAMALEIDPAGLERTVSEFNRNAAASPPVDPHFHRGESAVDQIAAGDHAREGTACCLAPLQEPPFYGARIWPGNCGTCGGPRINQWGQVLNAWGEVIPRLYAAGNVAGVGAPGPMETGGGGGTIGPALTFGYLAGTHVSAR